MWSEEVSRAEVIKLLPSAFDGTLLKHPKVHLARAREVEVELSDSLPAHVDGELLPPAAQFQGKGFAGGSAGSSRHRVLSLRHLLKKDVLW